MSIIAIQTGASQPITQFRESCDFQREMVGNQPYVRLTMLIRSTTSGTITFVPLSTQCKHQHFHPLRTHYCTTSTTTTAAVTASNTATISPSPSISVPARLFYNDIYQVLLPKRYERFPMQKYAEIRKKLQKMVLPQYAEFVPSPLANIEDLKLCHEEDYILRYIRGEFTKDEILRSGFPWSQEGVRRSFSTVGGTVAAVNSVLQDRDEHMDYVDRDGVVTRIRKPKPYVSTHIAGGTHHAGFNTPRGFCIFNDIAVAACVAKRDFSISRILIVDCDVHAGEGTSFIFTNHLRDRDVYTLSLHCEANIFGELPVSTKDIFIPAGCGDDEYLNILQPALAEAWLANQPELVIFQAGVDSSEHDRIGRLKLTRDGLRRRNFMVLDYFLALGDDRGSLGVGPQTPVPVVACMGGGYPKDVEVGSVPFQNVVDLHCDVYLACCERNAMAVRKHGPRL